MAGHGFVAKRSDGLGESVALAGVVLQGLERAALRAHLREHLGEGALGPVVRRVVVVLRVSALAKPGHDAERDALGQDEELGAARRSRRHEAGRGAVLVVVNVDAVEGAGVQMGIMAMTFRLTWR